MIILDDDFSAIVTALKYGRNFLVSARKYVQFSLTVNFTFLCVVSAGAAASGEFPFSPLQMMWIVFFM
jgi:magnesium-transporting ATPase (P-type)